MNEAWNSWTLLDTTAMAGQMRTSGSLPQRFGNGNKANKDNSINHCRLRLLGAQTLGWRDWVSFPREQRKETGGRASCVLGFSRLQFQVPATMGDNFPGKVRDCLS